MVFHRGYVERLIRDLKVPWHRGGGKDGTEKWKKNMPLDTEKYKIYVTPVQHDF